MIIKNAGDVPYEDTTGYRGVRKQILIGSRVLAPASSAAGSFSYFSLLFPRPCVPPVSAIQESCT